MRGRNLPRLFGSRSLKRWPGSRKAQGQGKKRGSWVKRGEPGRWEIDYGLSRITGDMHERRPQREVEVEAGKKDI